MYIYAFPCERWADVQEQTFTRRRTCHCCSCKIGASRRVPCLRLMQVAMKIPRARLVRLVACALCMLCAQSVLASTATPVDVYVDLNSIKSVGGVANFRRGSYINMHYTLSGEKLGVDRLTYLFDELDVSLGRTAMGPSRSTPPFALRPSVAELYERGGEPFLQWYNLSGDVELLRKYRLAAGMVMFDHVEAFDIAQGDDYGFGEHAVRFFRAYFNASRGVPVPHFYEPLNEAFVAARSRRSTAQGRRSLVQAMSRFYLAVCQKVKANKDLPVLIGGDASGWVEYDFDDFELFNDTTKIFLDVAGECIDFVSIHPYNMQGAKLEAILDLIDCYNLKSHGELRPFVFSEFGSTSPSYYYPASGADQQAAEYTPSRDWAILSAAIDVLMQSFGRPDSIVKTVPFITGHSAEMTGHSLDSYPWAIARYADDGNTQWTHLVKLYEIFRGVVGDFYHAVSGEINVLAHTVARDRVAWLLLKNLHATDSYRLRPQLSTGASNTARITVRRLFLQQDPYRTPRDVRQGLARSGTPTLSEYQLRRLDYIVIGPQEMIAVMYELDRPVRASWQVVRSTHNSGKFLLPIQANRSETFHFYNVPAGNLLRAVVRLSISRPRTLSMRPYAEFNRVVLNVDPRFAGANGTDWTYFGALQVDVPIRAVVGSDNSLAVRFDDRSGGWISSCVLVVERREAAEDVRREGDVPPSDEDVSHLVEGQILNGHFNDGLNLWETTGNVQTIPHPRKEGEQSVLLGPGFSSLGQLVAVRPHWRYALSAQLRLLRQRSEVVLSAASKSTCGGDTKRSSVPLEFDTGQQDFVRVKIAANGSSGAFISNVRLIDLGGSPVITDSPVSTSINSSSAHT